MPKLFCRPSISSATCYVVYVQIIRRLIIAANIYFVVWHRNRPVARPYSRGVLYGVLNPQTTTVYFFLWIIMDSWRMEWITATGFVNFWKLGGFQNPQDSLATGLQKRHLSVELLRATICRSTSRILSTISTISAATCGTISTKSNH